VRLLGLMTMRALAEADRLERVVRPALRRARLGVSSFWIWHRSISSLGDLITTEDTEDPEVQP
jgi:hypothetical protein